MKQGGWGFTLALRTFAINNLPFSTQGRKSWAVGVAGKVRAGVPRLGEEQGAGAEEVPAGIRACRSVFV